MKKMLFVSLITLFIVAAMSHAQTAPLASPEIKGTLDFTFGTKYVWRGFNVFGERSAISPSVDLFSPATNFGINVTAHRANGSGYEDFQRWDYNLYYLMRFFESEQQELDIRLDYVYYNYPRTRNDYFDLQELNMVMSMPKLLQVEGLVPSYVLVKLWPSDSGSFVGAKSIDKYGIPTHGTASGFAHIFMLDYAMPYVCPFTGVDRKLNWHAEAVFNDGVAPNGANVDHDWSDGVIGATTSYELAENLFLTPGLFFQSSWEKTVNKSDQLWATTSLTYKF